MRDDLMFEPIRGGNRGGAGNFKWSDVSADKDREHYLGHSINAPTGRWQKNKDVHWYGRDKKDTDAERQEEIRKIKEAEAEALAAALGFAPDKRQPTVENEKKDEEVSREEKRKRKEERREERRRRKELRRSSPARRRSSSPARRRASSPERRARRRSSSPRRP